MSINFAGLKLNNPYIAASGCWGYGWEGEIYFPGLKWGAVTSKTITIKKREGNPPPRIFEVNGGIINSIGLQNCGLNYFLKNDFPEIKQLPYPVIISIFGENLEDWKKLTIRLTKERVKALELNLSCPNIKGANTKSKTSVSDRMTQNINKCCKLVKILKDITSIPLIAKINALDNPVELSRALKNAGINGIVCSNTFPSAIVHDNKIYEGGLSGAAIKPLTLKIINEINKNVDIDIAACGGIISPEDIKDYKLAGAKVFVLGSILFVKPEIVNDLL